MVIFSKEDRLHFLNRNRILFYKFPGLRKKKKKTHCVQVVFWCFFGGGSNFSSPTPESRDERQAKWLFFYFFVRVNGSLWIRMWLGSLFLLTGCSWLFLWGERRLKKDCLYNNTGYLMTKFHISVNCSRFIQFVMPCQCSRGQWTEKKNRLEMNFKF